MSVTSLQHSADIPLRTSPGVHLVDLTSRVQGVVDAARVQLGQCLVFTTGSTAAVTTLEFEPGLKRDLPAALERLFPQGLAYAHEEAWHDGNGHSHVPASFLKPDLVVPVRDGRLHRGPWQQIVFVELDNKPRERSVGVHVWGTGRPRTP